MQSDSWEMDCLDANQNQKMACMLKKSTRIYGDFARRASNYEFRHYRSKVYTPVHVYHCWSIQFGKVNLLHASNSQCSRVYCSSTGTYMYCYSIYQTLSDQFPDVEFVEGLPDLNMFDVPCSSLMTSCMKPTKRFRNYFCSERPT